MQIPLSEFDLPAIHSSRCWVTDVRVGVTIVRTPASHKPLEKAAFFFLLLLALCVEACVGVLCDRCIQ